MCGRYRRTTSEEELARRYHIPIPSERDLPISWNIAPTQDVLATRQKPESKQRTLDTLRWGLIPNWAKDPKIAYNTINARVEAVDTRYPGRRSGDSGISHYAASILARLLFGYDQRTTATDVLCCRFAGWQSCGTEGVEAALVVVRVAKRPSGKPKSEFHSYSTRYSVYCNY
jgi:hypothetical protein